MVWGTFATFEGRRWTRLALEAGGSETPVEVAARLERMDATLCWKLGDYKGALAAATRALAHQSTLGDQVEIARAELEVGNSLLLLGRADEAEHVLRRALAKAERNGADRLAAKILYLLGETLAAIGDFTAARAACAKAFTLFRDAKGDRRIVGLVTRAEIEFQAGDVAAALRLNEEAFREIPSLGENENAQVLESALHANAAAYLISLDRYDEARTYARTALETAARLRFPPEKLWALLHLAAISVLEPQAHGTEQAIEAVERAARLIGFVSNQYDEMGGALGPTERREFERILDALGVALPPDRISSLRANGAAMSDDEAVAEAMHV
jgi:tetratricopeptide (TPR) repeat protein